MRLKCAAVMMSVLLPFSVALSDDAAPAKEQAKPDFVDLKNNGVFGFPQDKARVLADTDDVRLSVFTDNAHMYVQAIIWNDNSDKPGKTDDGRDIGDNASLCIDADANREITPEVDRTYSLNPWPTLPGLRYSILLGGGASTGLQVDSDGGGAIRYVDDASGKKVRVDSFLIPLSAINRKTGDDVNIAYWASSTDPKLVVNSVGYESEKRYWSFHLPHEKYHNIKLTAGDLVIMPSVVPDGRDDDVPDELKPEPLAKTPTVGSTPPELDAKEWLNIDGPVTFESLRGNVVVIEFWATWCGPCVAGIPHLNKLHDEHEKDGLRIVSFTDQTREHVEEFMKKTEMHYALGTGSQLSRRYGVTGIPHAFIVGRDGKLRWHGHPGVPEFDAQVEKALKEPVTG